MNEFEEIKSLEKELVMPSTRRNVVRLNELIADEFEEWGVSGQSYSKKELLATLPEAPEVHYVLSSFTYKELAVGCVLVKYQSEEAGVRANRSSIWVKYSGHWQLLHHQATAL